MGKRKFWSPSLMLEFNHLEYVSELTKKKRVCECVYADQFLFRKPKSAWKEYSSQELKLKGWYVSPDTSTYNS